MANNNIISTGKATQGQFVVSYQANGNGAAIPVINGKEEPRLMFGYVSESDRIGCLKLIEEALKATEGDVSAAMRYMYEAAMITAKEIKADEAVDVDGVEVIISYEAREAYLHGEKVADIEDITCELPGAAIRAMLIDRARLYLEEKAREFDDAVDSYWDEYNDCPYEDDEE